MIDCVCVMQVSCASRQKARDANGANPLKTGALAEGGTPSPSKLHKALKTRVLEGGYLHKRLILIGL